MVTLSSVDPCISIRVMYLSLPETKASFDPTQTTLYNGLHPVGIETYIFALLRNSFVVKNAYHLQDHLIAILVLALPLFPRIPY